MVLTVYPSRAILDEHTSFYDLTEVDGVAEWAALSIPNAQIAVSDGDLYMNAATAPDASATTSSTASRARLPASRRRGWGCLRSRMGCWRLRGTSGEACFGDRARRADRACRDHLRELEVSRPRPHPHIPFCDAAGARA